MLLSTQCHKIQYAGITDQVKNILHTVIVELLTSITQILFICKNKTIKQINLIILEHMAL